MVNLKNIIPYLSCLVCNEPLLSVTRLCERGHTFCVNCRPYLNYCTECLGKFLTETRNYSIENIANLVKYKCNNYDAGCRTLLTRDLILKHNDTCSMSPVICPLGNIPRAKCTWTGCILRCLVCIVVSCLACIVVVVLCVLLSSYVYLLYHVCIAVFTLDAGLLARSRY